MDKVFISKLVAVTSESVIMSTGEKLRGDLIAIRAGAAILNQAKDLVGQTLRYTAHIDADTRCLSNPRFVIGSQFGLRPVTADLELDFKEEDTLVSG